MQRFDNNVSETNNTNNFETFQSSSRQQNFVRKRRASFHVLPSERPTVSWAPNSKDTFHSSSLMDGEELYITAYCSNAVLKDSTQKVLDALMGLNVSDHDKDKDYSTNDNTSSAAETLSSSHLPSTKFPEKLHCYNFDEAFEYYDESNQKILPCDSLVDYGIHDEYQTRYTHSKFSSFRPSIFKYSRGISFNSWYASQVYASRNTKTYLENPNDKHNIELPDICSQYISRAGIEKMAEFIRTPLSTISVQEIELINNTSEYETDSEEDLGEEERAYEDIDSNSSSDLSEYEENLCPQMPLNNIEYGLEYETDYESEDDETAYSEPTQSNNSGIYVIPSSPEVLASENYTSTLGNSMADQNLARNGSETEEFTRNIDLSLMLARPAFQNVMVDELSFLNRNDRGLSSQKPDHNYGGS